MNSKTRILPRPEQVDALLGDEFAISEKFENLVAEDELGLMGMDIRNGFPRAILVKDSATDDGMDVWVPLQRRPEGLDDGDHAGPGVGLVNGGDHHLADGLVGESRELSQKLSMK